MCARRQWLVSWILLEPESWFVEIGELLSAGVDLQARILNTVICNGLIMPMHNETKLTLI